jgi:pimeloyl-ACP methyl ester carboxylesterase
VTTKRYRRRTVETSTGPATFGEWAGGGVPVVAIHGMSSQHLLWLWTAEAAPDVHLFAPDLRGRGAGVDLPGPYGLDRHAGDVLALLDACGLDRVVLVGMSMGGFVAVAVADRAPDRVASLLLVDGGAPMALPEGASAEEPVADRLLRAQTSFASFDAYRDVFRAGVGAMLDPTDPRLEEYLDYDLVPDGDRYRTRLSPEAVLQDTADVFGSTAPEARFLGLSMPVMLLHAQWSVGAGSPPAYPQAAIDGWRAQLPHLQTELIPEVDHAGTVMTEPGAAAVAATVDRATNAT